MRRAINDVIALVALVGCVLGFCLLLKAQGSQVPSNTWAPGGAMAQPRTGASAALLPDGRVLITGGVGVNGATATAELFSPTGGFTAAASMKVARTGHSSVALRDGRVLVMGGSPSTALRRGRQRFTVPRPERGRSSARWRRHAAVIPRRYWPMDVC